MTETWLDDFLWKCVMSRGWSNTIISSRAILERLRGSMYVWDTRVSSCYLDEGVFVGWCGGEGGVRLLFVLFHILFCVSVCRKGPAQQISVFANYHLSLSASKDAPFTLQNFEMGGGGRVWSCDICINLPSGIMLQGRFFPQIKHYASVIRSPSSQLTGLLRAAGGSQLRT